MKRNKFNEIEIEKNKYIIDIGYDVIDVGEFTDLEWGQLKELAKQALSLNVTSEVSKAYIIAFVVYVAQKIELSIPFDPKLDKIN